MSVRRGLAWSLGGNIGFFGVQFGASLVLARLLTPAEMGIYAASVALVYLINGVLNVGLTGYLVRERALEPAKIGSVYALMLAQAALLAGALLAGAELIGALTREARVGEAVRILAIFAAVTPIQTTLSGLLQRRMQFGLVTAIGLSNVVVAAGVTIALALDGWGWRAMPWGTVAGALTAFVLALAVQRRDLVHRPRLTHARAILLYGWRIMTASLIQNGAARLPDILLARIAGVAATGLYNRGAGLIDVVNNSVMRSFQRVMGSAFARDRDTARGIGPAYARMSRVLTGLFWPAFGVLAVLASPIIALLYGTQWLAAAPVLAVIALAQALALVVATRTEVMVTMGRERELAGIEAARGVWGLTSFSIGAHYGLEWAAASRVLDALIAVLLYSPGIHAATGLGWGAVARALAPSLLAALAAVAPALGFMLWRGWPAMLPPLELAGVLAACALAWVAVLALSGHALAQEAVRLLGPRLRRWRGGAA